MAENTPPSVLRERLRRTKEINDTLEKELAELCELTTYEKQLLLVEQGCTKMEEKNRRLQDENHSLIQILERRDDVLKGVRNEIQQKKIRFSSLKDDPLLAGDSSSERAVSPTALIDEVLSTFDALSKFIGKDLALEEVRRNSSVGSEETLTITKEEVLNEVVKLSQILETSFEHEARRLSDSFLIEEKLKSRASLFGRKEVAVQTNVDVSIPVVSVDVTSHLLDLSNVVDVNDADTGKPDNSILASNVEELEKKLLEIRDQCQLLTSANEDLEKLLNFKEKEIQKLNARLNIPKSPCTCRKPTIEIDEYEGDIADIPVIETLHGSSSCINNSFLPTIPELKESSFDGSFEETNAPYFTSHPADVRGTVGIVDSKINVDVSQGLGDRALLERYRGEIADLQRCRVLLADELEYCLSELSVRDEQITLLQSALPVSHNVCAGISASSDLFNKCNEEVESLETLVDVSEGHFDSALDAEVTGRVVNVLNLIQKGIDTFFAVSAHPSTEPCSESSFTNMSSTFGNVSSYPQQFCSILLDSTDNSHMNNSAASPNVCRPDQILKDVRNMRQSIELMTSDVTREFFNVVSKLERVESIILWFRNTGSEDRQLSVVSSKRENPYRNVLIEDIREKAQRILDLQKPCLNKQCQDSSLHVSAQSSDESLVKPGNRHGPGSVLSCTDSSVYASATEGDEVNLHFMCTTNSKCETSLVSSEPVLSTRNGAFDYSEEGCQMSADPNDDNLEVILSVFWKTVNDFHSVIQGLGISSLETPPDVETLTLEKIENYAENVIDILNKALKNSQLSCSTNGEKEKCNPDCAKSQSLDIKFPNQEDCRKKTLRTSALLPANQNTIDADNEKENCSDDKAALSRTIKNWEKLIHDSNTRIAELVHSKNNLEVKLLEKIAENNNLVQQLSKAHSEIESHQKILSEKTGLVDELTSVIADKDVQLENVETKMRSASTTIEELETNLMNKQNLQTSLQNAEDKLEKEVAEREQLQNNFQEVSSKLYAADLKVVTLEKDITEINRNLHDVTEQLSSAEKKVADFEIKISSLNDLLNNDQLQLAEKESLQNNLRDLTDRVLKSDGKVAELEAALLLKNGQIQEAGAAQKVQQDIIADLDCTVTTLKMTLDHTRASWTKLIISSSADIDHLQANIRTIEVQLAKESVKKTELEKTLLGFEHQLLTAHQKISDLETEVSTMNHDLQEKDQLMNSVDMVQRQMTIEKAEKEELLIRLDVVTGQLNTAEEQVGNLGREITVVKENLIDGNQLQPVNKLLGDELVDKEELKNIQNVTDRLSSAEERNDEFEKHITILKETILDQDQLQVSLQMVEEQLSKELAEKVELQSSLQEARDRLSTSEQKISELEKEICAANANLVDYNQLNEQLARELAEKEELVNSLQEARDRVSTGEQKIAELEKEICAANANLVDYNQLNEQLARELAEKEELESSLQEAKDQLAAAKQKSSELDKELCAANANMGDNNQLNEQLAQELAEKEELVSSLQESRDRLSTAEQKISELEKKIWAANANLLDNNKLNEQLARELAEKEELESSLQEAKDQLATANQKISELENEICAANANLLDNNQLNERLTRELAEKEELVSSHQEARDTLSTAELKSSELEKEICAANANLVDYNQLNEQLARELAEKEELESSLQEAKDQLATAKQKISELDKELCAANANLVDNNQLNEQLAQELAEKEELVSSLQDSRDWLSTAEQKISELEKKICAANANLLDNNQLNEQLTRELAENEVLVSSLQEARDRLSTAEQKISELEKEICAANANLVDNNQLNEQLARELVEKEELVSSLQEAKDQLATANQKISELEKEICAANANLLDNNQLNEQLARELVEKEELVSSLQEAVDQLATANQKISELEKEICAANANLLDNNQLNEQLARELVEKEELVSSLQEAVDQLATANQKISELEKEICAANANLLDNNQLNEQLARELVEKEELVSSLQEAKDLLATANQKISELEKEICAANANLLDNNQLNEQLARELVEKEELVSSLQEAVDQLATANQKISELEKEICAANANLLDNNQLNEQLARELVEKEELMGSLQEAEDQLATANQKISELEKEICAANANLLDNNQLNEQLARELAEKEELESSLQEAKGLLATANQKISELVKEICAANANLLDNNQLNEQLARELAEKEELESSLQEAKDLLATANQKISELEKEICAANANLLDNNQLNEQLARELVEKEELESSLQEAKDLLATANQKISELEKEICAANANLLDNNQLNEQLARELVEKEELVSSRREAKDQLATANQKISELEKEICAANANLLDNNQLNEQLARELTEKEELQINLQDANKQISELEKEITSLKELDSNKQLSAELHSALSTISELGEEIEKIRGHPSSADNSHESSHSSVVSDHFLKSSSRQGHSVVSRNSLSNEDDFDATTFNATVQLERSVFVTDLAHMERTVLGDNFDPLSMTIDPNLATTPRKMDAGTESSDESEFGTPVANKFWDGARHIDTGNKTGSPQSCRMDSVNPLITDGSPPSSQIKSSIASTNSKIRVIAEDCFALKEQMQQWSQLLARELSSTSSCVLQNISSFGDQISLKDAVIKELEDSLQNTRLTTSIDKESLQDRLNDEISRCSSLKCSFEEKEKEFETKYNALREECDENVIKRNSIESAILELLRQWNGDEEVVSEDVVQELKLVLGEAILAKNMMKARKQKTINFIAELKDILSNNELLEDSLSKLKLKFSKKCESLTTGVKSILNESNNLLLDYTSTKREIEEALQRAQSALSVLREESLRNLNSKEDAGILESKLRECQDRISHYETTIDQASSECSSLTEKVKLLEENNCSLSTANEALVENVEISEIKNKELIDKLEELKASNGTLSSEMAKLQENIVELNEKISAKELQLSTCEKEKSQANSECSLCQPRDVELERIKQTLTSALASTTGKPVDVSSSSDDVVEKLIHMKSVLAKSNDTLHSIMKLLNSQELCGVIALECLYRELKSNDVRDAYLCKKKFADEIHCMEPEMRIEELVQLSLLELQSKLVSTVVEREEIFISEFKADYDHKLASLTHQLSQYEDKEKYMNEMIGDLTKENEKLEETLSNLKSQSVREDIGHSKATIGHLEKSIINKEENKFLTEEIETLNSEISQLKRDAAQSTNKSKLWIHKVENVLTYFSELLIFEGNDSFAEVTGFDIKNEDFPNHLAEILRGVLSKVVSMRSLFVTLRVKSEEDALAARHLKTRLEHVEKEHSRCTETDLKLGRLQDELTTKELSLSKLNLDYANLEIQLNELKKNIVSKECDVVAGLTADKARLQLEIEENKKYTDELKSRLNAVSRKSKNLSLDLKAVSSQCTSIKVEFLSLQNETITEHGKVLSVFQNLNKQFESLVEEEMNKMRSFEVEVGNLRGKLSARNEENSKLANEKRDLENSLANESAEKQSLIERLKKLEDAPIRVGHDDKSCPYKEKVQEYKKELWIIRQKSVDEQKKFDVMKKNIEEDLAFKTDIIKKLEERNESTVSQFNLRLASSTTSYNQVCKKLEEAEEKISFLRDMNSQDKKRLEKDIDNLNKEISKLQLVKAFIEGLGMDCDTLQETLPEIKKKLSEYENLQTKSREMAEKNEELDYECDFMNKQIEFLETRNAEMFKQNMEDAEKLEKLKKELADNLELIGRSKQLQEEFDSLKISESKSMKALEESKLEFNQLTQKLSEAELEKSRLEHAYKLLETNLESRNQKILHYVSEMKNYESMLMEKTKLNQEVMTALEEERSKCADLYHQKSSVEKELVGLQKELDECRARLKALGSRLEESASIEEVLQKVSAERDEALRSYSDLKSQLPTAQRAIREKESLVESLRSSYDQLASEKKEKEDILKARERELVAKIEVLVSEASDNAVRIAQWESLMESAPVDVYKTKISSLEMEVETLKNELSRFAVGMSPRPQHVTVEPASLSNKLDTKTREDFEREIHNLEKKQTVLKRLCQHRRQKMLEYQDLLKHHNIHIPTSTTDQSS